MKAPPKDDTPLIWHKPPPTPRPFTRYLLYFFLFILITCLYTLNFAFSPSCPTPDTTNKYTSQLHATPPPKSWNSSFNATLTPTPSTATGLQHIVFGIAASSGLWDKRKEYIKLWWKPRMRGYVWLDKYVKELPSEELPPIQVSSDTSQFPYTHPIGTRAALRITRIVSEMYRLNLPNVRWFVLGDDDTVFVPENLAGVLSRFDHRQPYYIGAVSESHLQNIFLSYGMAFGGGGFAISRPLAAALSKMQDRCIHRYPALYGSDDRIQACMAELGVPLTKHAGFHQYDVHGDLRGLLAAHPVTPLVSLHHLDMVEPVFPHSASRAIALRKLFAGPIKIDSAGIVQQSICYDGDHRWTVSVSWGFVVDVVRGVMSPREMEMPARTFLNWHKRADYTAWSFNTRPVARNPCQRPFVYYLDSARIDDDMETTVTVYRRHKEEHPECRWDMPVPAELLDRIVVYKKVDPQLWDRSPRRNCCRVLKDDNVGERSMAIDVGVCEEGEYSERF